MTTFYEWLMQFKGQDNAYGDLVGDADEDVTFPRDAECAEDVACYLRFMGADDNCLETVEKAWKEYQQFRKK